VRIIAATHKVLEKEMAEGRFREDLFYRLNVIPIHIAPLRERPEDIPPLVDAFVRKQEPQRRRRVSAEAMNRLIAQPWKGNARELENALERALALTDAEEIGPEDLPLPGERCRGEGPPSETFLRSAAQRGLSLRDVEDLYIEEILGRTGGNKVRAAKLLGIDRKTLYRRSERGARHGQDGEEQ
jgi:DNA-binding NtrC family response regulator